MGLSPNYLVSIENFADGRLIPTWDANSSGHVAPSHLGLAYALPVATHFSPNVLTWFSGIYTLNIPRYSKSYMQRRRFKLSNLDFLTWRFHMLLEGFTRSHSMVVVLFDFVLQHRKGHCHRNADVISRYPLGMKRTVPTCSWVRSVGGYGRCFIVLTAYTWKIFHSDKHWWCHILLVGVARQQADNVCEHCCAYAICQISEVIPQVWPALNP